ncbi:Solute carrier family 2, facilitated glucose transporter member 3 [Eumeta japonica]|uniref:Solute carrier family 2, facilitated glucose transporter member 3 n=1 Tax=Eumeta variegata TaxID=151549 RepID=A0A4C1XYR7_EUMVA|nr:Solute carrier family 2, facilitated glucose transporter member 3 [Eumeta japonica]
MFLKNATIVTSLLYLAGALMFLLCRIANSVEMLVLGRLLVGLSGGLTTSIVPMYLTELAPLWLTGATGVACPMGVNVGVLVGQVMGLEFLLGRPDDWTYLLAVYAVLVIVCLPVLLVLPESPKYLFLVRRNEEKALQELSRLRGVPASLLIEDIEGLHEEARASHAIDFNGEGRWGLLRAVRDPTLRMPLLLTCSMQAGQQTSGINAVFYYSHTIFEEAQLSKSSSQYATIACGFINVCTALLMLHLLPRCGRRPLLLISIFSASVILACLAISIRLMHLASWMPYMCMITVLAYVLVYGFGLGPIPYFIASEIFEVAPRSAGMAWGSLANWGGNFLVGMFFPSLLDAIGPYSFLVFAIITAALFVFQKIYFPETYGRTPTQVMQLCNERSAHTPVQA